MDVAETQMKSSPDSSLSLLYSISEEGIRLPHQKARYSLLKVMAKDKCYQDVSGDTIILVSHEWYRHHGSKCYRTLSSYYLGIVQQSRGNNIEAALAFREAENLAEELKDYRQLSLVEQHLSAIFYANYDHIRALEYAEKSLEAAKKAGEYLMEDYCRYDMAVQLCSQYRYREAESLLVNILDNNQKDSVLYSIAAQKMAESCIFKNNPDIEVAKRYYHEIEERAAIQFDGHDYGLLALICQYEGDDKTANFYIEEARKKLESPLDSALFYNDCRNVYDLRGDWEQAHIAKTESAKIENRIVTQLLGQSVTHALENHYNNQLSQERALSKNRFYIFCLIGVLLLGIASLIIIFIVKRNRKVVDDMAKIQDLSLELMNTLIADKIQKLQRLSESYFSWEDKSIKQREEKNGRLAKDEIISLFRAQMSELRNDKSFMLALEKSVNLTQGGLLDKVRQLSPMNKEVDYSIITLLFSGFSIKSISFLLRMSEASLRMRKTRYKHQFENLPEPDRSTFLQHLG